MIYYTIREILKKEKGKILVVVPNINLVIQMGGNLAEYGWDCDELTLLCAELKKDVNFDKRVLVSTYQSLMSKDQEFFEEFEAIIIDEVHLAKEEKILTNILKYAINAKYRLGFTGTLPETQLSMMNINAWLGDVLGTITAKELMDRGILSQLQIINVLIKYPESFIKLNKNRSYPEEVSLIENLEERNMAIDKILDHQKAGQNTLMLFTHLDHLASVEKHIMERYPNRFKIRKITGNVSGKKRDIIRKNLEISEDELVLAIYKTCEAGMDIRKLHNIILAARF